MEPRENNLISFRLDVNMLHEILKRGIHPNVLGKQLLTDYVKEKLLKLPAEDNKANTPNELERW